VFKAWLKDNPEKYDAMCEGDFVFWKVGPKMIKDDEDRINCETILKNNYKFLKDIHIYLASKSSPGFPGILKQELAGFIKESGI
jgi:hypothetical protein